MALKKRRVIGESIILVLDANEPLVDVNRPEKITDIAKLFRNYRLTDVFDKMHKEGWGNPNDKKNHNIDHIAVSEAILPPVKRCGLFPFDEICDTDHRRGYVLWDMELLFGLEPDDLNTLERRKLILAYPDRVDKYRSYVLAKFKELKLLKALTALTHKARRKGIWTVAMKKKYNTLDE